MAASVTAVSEADSAAAGEAVPTEDPVTEWWRVALDIHRDLGCRYITMLRLPESLSDETTARYAEYFDAIGDMAAQRGMKFCFHPDKSHLTAVNGVSAFDAIAAATDPAKVWFEIDTYETAEAGIDTKALLRRYGERVLLLHAHDYGVVGESGRIDFRPHNSRSREARREGHIRRSAQLHAAAQELRRAQHLQPRIAAEHKVLTGGRGKYVFEAHAEI